MGPVMEPRFISKTQGLFLLGCSWTIFWLGAPKLRLGVSSVVTSRSARRFEQSFVKGKARLGDLLFCSVLSNANIFNANPPVMGMFPGRKWSALPGSCQCVSAMASALMLLFAASVRKYKKTFQKYN